MRFVFFLAALFILAHPASAQQSEAQIRDTIKGHAMVLFGHRDFAGLNALSQQYRASGEKTPGGVSKLSLFYAGVAALPLGDAADDSQWWAIFLFAQEWVKKYPSPAAIIAGAELNIRYAWEQRGADGTPSPQQQASFLSHIRTAHRQLDDGKAVAGADPEWSVAMERVSRAEQQAAAGAQAQTAVGSTPLKIARPTAWLPGDEINVRTGIEVQARQLFEQKKFAELNALARRYSNGERTPAGTQELQFFYNGLADYAYYQTPSLGSKPNERQWRAVFDRAQEWSEKNPSPAAYVALADFNRELAWAWRGPGMANTVDANSWKPFRDQLKIAHDILAAHKVDAAINPEWYVAMENLAREEDWPEQDTNALYAEAIKKNRYYDGVYYAIATRLEPKWGGSWVQLEQFADFAARNTKDKIGDLLYARIYMWAGDCHCKMFGEAHLNWNRMKADFQDMLKRYPEPWNTNRYAYYACQAQDKATEKALLDKLATPIIPAWDSDTAAYENCKDWASTG